MAATLMSDSPAAILERSGTGGEPTVQAIIAAARRPQAAPARGAWLCGGVSGLAWFLCFFPANWGPLAFLATVPLLLLVRIEQPTRRMYLAVFATWYVATLAALSWMAANPPMIAGWLAMSVYLALYAPAFLLASRVAVHRMHVPLVIAAPVVWTGLEFVRAHLMTGFPWYLVGHTQWRWTTFIQIADLVGVYGVSFVVMACAAAAALCVPDQVFIKLRLLPVREGATAPAPGASRRARFVSVAFVLTLLAGSLGYGMLRLSGDHFSAGPRVALIQGNFPSRLYRTHSEEEKWHRHNRMTAMAVGYQPDFVIWPESASPWPLLELSEDLEDEQLISLVGRYARGDSAQDLREGAAFVRETFGDLATQANAALVLGTSAVVVDNEHGLRRYNSAAFAVPELGLLGRYDKRHRVVFGEYVPLRDVLPFMQAFSPYTDAFSIDAGTAAKIFSHAGYRVSPLICYEDTVPTLVRNVIAQSEVTEEGPIDLLVNVTNDGWFDKSSEQPQHLVTSLFRAVETRTPLARSANTGISAVIDGDGRIVQPVAFLDGETGEPLSMTERSGRFRKDLNAVVVADVPLDSRSSPYVRFGDWFAIACGAMVIFCLAWSVMPRRQ